MRLALYFTAGDGCTYHCDVALPLNYQSAEDAAVDFEGLVKDAAEKRLCEFAFDNKTLLVSHFMIDGVYYPPDILTVDEWFEQLA